MLKLMDRNLFGAEFARQSFFASPPAGTAIEDVLNPEYWAHVARRLNPHDIIEVVPEDGSFYARLIVINPMKLSAKVQKLEYIELIENAKKEIAALTSQFEPKWAGPNGKWRVIRKSDGAAIGTDSFQTKEDAETWINSNIKDIAA